MNARLHCTKLHVSLQTRTKMTTQTHHIHCIIYSRTNTRPYYMYMCVNTTCTYYMYIQYLFKVVFKLVGSTASSTNDLRELTQSILCYHIHKSTHADSFKLDEMQRPLPVSHSRGRHLQVFVSDTRGTVFEIGLDKRSHGPDTF